MTQPLPAPIVLFCKSYEGDLKRVQRLVASIARHNRDSIPVYISVPQKDLSLFEAQVVLPDDALATGQTLHWLSDETIVAAQPDAQKALVNYREWDGRLSQQVVKSEFWRLGFCDNYVCLDSDSEFIRDFHIADFMDVSSSIPFTVISQAKELLQLAENRKIHKVLQQFQESSAQGKAIFNRTGPDFDFSQTPPAIWSVSVWKALDERYLQPKQMTFWDAIDKLPYEMRWYGEALMHFKCIPIIPIEPLFRVYHYDWHYMKMKKLGESRDSIKPLYLGVVMQSNWDFDMDYGAQAKRKSGLSRLARRVKRSLAQYR